MRWRELFDDLEAQWQSLERADRDAEIAERTRGELARVLLMNRLRAHIGGRLTVHTLAGGAVAGELQRVGADWLLVACPQECVVPLAAVAAVTELGPSSVSPDGVGLVAGRLTLASALRALARDRAAVTVVLGDGTVVTGTPDRVGADFVDLAVHARDEVPRPALVRRRATVPHAAIAVVRRQPPEWG
jgi:hypothetical protein